MDIAFVFRSCRCFEYISICCDIYVIDGLSLWRREKFVVLFGYNGLEM